MKFKSKYIRASYENAFENIRKHSDIFSYISMFRLVNYSETPCHKVVSYSIGLIKFGIFSGLFLDHFIQSFDETLRLLKGVYYRSTRLEWKMCGYVTHHGICPTWHLNMNRDRWRHLWYLHTSGNALSLSIPDILPTSAIDHFTFQIKATSA